ncbi:MAG TPA: ATP-binding cassette domain-containing protein, partial [Acidimicrobiales bacterium]|nr:ATP-binding cassette domain-containing protein [Acidimicrobiales bacterium]
GLTALDQVDLDVPPDAFVGLVGPNGAGKSTLFGVVSGLLRPSSGQVLLDGEEVTHDSPQARADAGLARTFQHPELFVGLTVREHLVLAYRSRAQKQRMWSDLFTLGSLRPVEAREREVVDGLVDSLGLRSVADRMAVGLPLGVSRLLELGRALATSPSVLLLDEPSSGLDSSETAELVGTLRRVAAERSVSVLMVEHDVELVMRLCSRIYVLDFGALIAEGTPDEVRRDPKVRAAYLGEEVADAAAREGAGATDSGPPARPGPTTRGAPVPEETPVPEAAAGRDRPAAEGTVAPGVVEDGGEVVLRVEDLWVRYGPAVAVAGASLSVRRGTALALLGPNGAGKSSLARAVSGLVPCAGGRVTLEGRDITSQPAHRVRRAGVVHLPEGRGIFRRLSVVENLWMGAAAVHGRRARHEAVDRAFDLFPTLAERRRQVAGSLSGGEQQMLSLARALTTSPTLLIADELSLGLAPKVVDLVFESLARAREAGVTVLMIEQYVHRALGFADECLVLQRGSVAWQGASDTVGEDVLEHYLGESVVAAS